MKRASTSTIFFSKHFIFAFSTLPQNAVARLASTVQFYLHTIMKNGSEDMDSCCLRPTRRSRFAIDLLRSFPSKQFKPQTTIGSGQRFTAPTTCMKPLLRSTPSWFNFEFFLLLFDFWSGVAALIHMLLMLSYIRTSAFTVITPRYLLGTQLGPQRCRQFQLQTIL